MDPNDLLENGILGRIKLMRSADLDDGDNNQHFVDLADDLIDAVEALDGWLRKGGALPERWQVPF